MTTTPPTTQPPEEPDDSYPTGWLPRSLREKHDLENRLDGLNDSDLLALLTGVLSKRQES